MSVSPPDDRLLQLKVAISSIPNFPKPGIVFRDFLPIFTSPSLTQHLTSLLADAVLESLPNNSDLSTLTIVGLESRGFLIGPLVAARLNAKFVPIRKKGKLPPPTIAIDYDLEYGSDSLEVRDGSISSGNSVVIVDDLLATGGTMKAAVTLLEKMGVVVQLCLVVIELPDLKGKGKLNSPFKSLMAFEGD